MQFSLLNLLLPVTALASPFILDERAAKDLSAQVKQNLTQTYTDIKALNATLNEFGDNSEPSFYQALALQSGGNAIEADLNSTIAEAKKSSVWTTAESTAIYNQVNTQSLPATQQLLQNFINHYPGLKMQGLASAVNSSLVTQKGLVQQQSAAFLAKSQGAAKKNGPALEQKLVAAFNKAIVVYSK